MLAKGLIERIANNLHKPALKLTDQALRALQEYDWPGNVRELENVLTQAMVHARGEALTPDLISLAGHSADSAETPPAVAQAQPGDASLATRTLDQVEAEHIQRVLDHTRGHKGNTCRILGISRPALDRKIKKYALILPSD